MSRSEENERKQKQREERCIELAADHFLEDTDVPVFTRARMKEAAQQLRLIAPGGGPYELHDIYNVKQQLNVTLSDIYSGDDCKAPILGLKYTTWQHVLAELKAKALSQYPRPTRPLSFVTFWYPDHECIDDARTREERFSEIEAEWETSSFRKELETFLHQNLEHMERIDRISCFGLGRIYDNPAHPRSLTRSYTQHLAACTVRDVLHKCRKLDDATDRIKIFAQDPMYCEMCKTTLRDRLDIEVTEDPEGFLLIDENTFVISIAPDVPVKQIAVDITADVGGPAGLFCSSRAPELHAKRLDEFQAYTDPTSPQVLEYVNRCATLDFDQKFKDVEDDSFSGTSVHLKMKPKA